MIYKKVASSSNGNAMVYHDIVMVDCGVNLKTIKPYARDLKMVLLTHEHHDHYKKNTIVKLAHLHPKIMWFAPEWLVDDLKKIGVDNVHLVEMNKVYQIGSIIISPFYLYHDVPNCGWRIVKDNFKIFHATDTSSLSGISAKDYDLYAIEYNHNLEKHLEAIDEKKSNGEYAYEERAIRTHLSFEKADEFINENKKEDSVVLKLHISTRYVGEVL